METELFLSRPAYRAGTPVVGSVRIHTNQPSIRSQLTSARLYLTARAHLCTSSSWRSKNEIRKLKSLYGEHHACLVLAASEERSRRDDGAAADSDETLIERADEIALGLRMHSQSRSALRLEMNSLGRQSFLGEDAVCFWMTNVLELLDVKESDVGRDACLVDNCSEDWIGAEELFNRPLNKKKNRYKIHHEPLKLPDYNVISKVLNAPRRGLDATFDGEDDSSESSESSDDDSVDTESSDDAADANNTPSAWEQIMASANTNTNNRMQQQQKSQQQLSQTQIALTFRANLPEDVPPTMSAECVKYFYTAVLVVTTADGEFIVTQHPFDVLTRNSPDSITAHPTVHHTYTRVHIGELYATSHSSSLPYHLSPIQALGEKQLNVVSDPPACTIVSRMTAERRTSTHRIQNENGALCGMMTLVGVGGPMGPGTRLGIIVRFANEYDEEVGEAGILPCHRVCCALVGEEHALCEGISVPASASGAMSQKRKTKSYVFDSSYEMVDFGYTHSISMGLLLPFDCPVTVKTDLVEVTVSLKLEFTVDRVAVRNLDEAMGHDADSLEGPSGFGVIRLELPIEVVHNDEMANEEEEENEAEVLSHLAAVRQLWVNDMAATSNGCFDDTGIHDDLKMLSLKLLA